MLSSDIPMDVWTSISDLIINPATHIALSQVCQNARAVYEDDEKDKWMALCRAIGVGRASQEKTIGWKRVLIEVVSHRKGCRMPQCYQYAVPPTNSVGDLITSSEASLQHQEYFKKKGLCRCIGHCCHKHKHNSATGEPALGAEEGENNGDEDMEDDLDDMFGGMGGPPPGFDPTAMMASLFTMLGVPGAPVTGGAGAMPLFIPGIPGAMAIPMQAQAQPPGPTPAAIPALVPGANPPVGAAPAQPNLPPHLNGPAGTAPAQPIQNLWPPGFGMPEFATPPPIPEAPKIEPHLLPLSWKNREYVPRRPMLHLYLADTGSVQFQHFINGYTALQPYVLQQGGPVGINWDDDSEDNVKESHKKNLIKLADHPLLARAFATNPPVTEIQFMMELFKFKVVNRDGVTLQDVVYHMKRYLEKPLSVKDRLDLCGSTHDHGQDGDEQGCPIDVFSTRLSYLLRKREYDGILQTVTAPEEEEVLDIYLRGTNQSRNGETICAFYPG